MFRLRSTSLLKFLTALMPLCDNEAYQRNNLLKPSDDDRVKLLNG